MLLAPLERWLRLRLRLRLPFIDVSCTIKNGCILGAPLHLSCAVSLLQIHYM